MGSELTLDRKTRKAVRPSRTATLTPTQVRLLALLILDPHRVFSRQELASELDVALGGINLHVFKLRVALGDEVIRTVYRRGYQLGIGSAERARPRPTSQASGLELHALAQRAWFGDRGPVGLTAQETRLLECLMERGRAIATHRELIHAGRLRSSGTSRALASSRLRTEIAKLRRKLNPLVGADVITTVKAAGYALATELLGGDRVEDA